MTKLIVVVGATGIQGGSVVKTFLEEPGWSIRGITRNTSSEAAQKLSKQGVEMVSSDLDDVDSLAKAFHGATAIFSVTDFWNPYFNPENRKKLREGQALNEWVYGYELQQGKNVFDAAAKIEGLERLVFSGLSDVSKWSGGKYTHVYHFDSKAHAVTYGKEKYPQLWKKTSVLQVGFYLSNFLSSPMMKPQKNAEGEFVYSLQNSDRPLPLIATEEDTGPLTKALVEAAPGKNLIGYREWMSLEGYVDTWKKVTGARAKVGLMTFDETVQAYGPELGTEFAENQEFIAQYGYEAGNDPTIVHPKDLEVKVNLPTVEEWMAKQDWSSMLNA